MKKLFNLLKPRFKSQEQKEIDALREQEMRLEYAWKEYKENAKRYEEMLDSEFSKRGGKNGRL